MTNPSPQNAPAFYVVGAARSGTTAVWSWLRQHPDVFLPNVKEPGFFAFAGRAAAPCSGPYDPSYVAEVTTNARDYDRLYAAKGRKRAGDVSPIYLIDTQAAARISDARPDARIVILLRDPVMRAFSQFLQHRREGIEPHASFEAALQDEDARMQEGWSWGHGYRANGCYAAQIKRYLDVFDPTQVLFLAFDSLQTEPEPCWHRLCEHLGLPPRPMPQNQRVNASSTLACLPAWPWITRHIRHPGPIQTWVKRFLPGSLTSVVRRRIDAATVSVPVLQDKTCHDLAKGYLHERDTVHDMSGLSLDGWST